MLLPQQLILEHAIQSLSVLKDLTISRDEKLKELFFIQKSLLQVEKQANSKESKGTFLLGLGFIQESLEEAYDKLHDLYVDIELRDHFVSEGGDKIKNLLSELTKDNLDYVKVTSKIN